MSTNWNDVEDQDYPESNNQGPFSVGPVDRMAFVDDDTPIELRGAGVYDSIQRPPKRAKPTARRIQREQRWSSEVEIPEYEDTSNIIGTIVRVVLIILIFAVLGLLVWKIIDSYQATTNIGAMLAPANVLANALTSLRL